MQLQQPGCEAVAVKGSYFQSARTAENARTEPTLIDAARRMNWLEPRNAAIGHG